MTLRSRVAAAAVMRRHRRRRRAAVCSNKRSNVGGSGSRQVSTRQKPGKTQLQGFLLIFMHSTLERDVNCKVPRNDNMINITERPKGIFLSSHFILCYILQNFCFCKLQLFRCFQTFGILTMRSIFQGMFSLKQTVLQYFSNMGSAWINSNDCHALIQKQLVAYLKISELGSEVKIRISSVSFFF